MSAARLVQLQKQSQCGGGLNNAFWFGHVPSQRNMAIDIKLKEACLLETDQNEETQALLRCIIHELRDIGVYIAQQNTRIEAISNVANISNVSCLEPMTSEVMLHNPKGAPGRPAYKIWIGNQVCIM